MFHLGLYYMRCSWSKCSSIGPMTRSYASAYKESFSRKYRFNLFSRSEIALQVLVTNNQRSVSRLALEEMLYSNQYSFPIPGRCKCYDRNFGFFAYLSSNVLKTCDNRCYLPLHLIFSKNCEEKHYKTTIRGRTVPLANSLATAIYSGHETHPLRF